MNEPLDRDALWRQACERAKREAELLYPADREEHLNAYCRLVRHYFSQYIGRKV